jgi:hypothetical protein
MHVIRISNRGMHTLKVKQAEFTKKLWCNAESLSLLHGGKPVEIRQINYMLPGVFLRSAELRSLTRRAGNRAPTASRVSNTHCWAHLETKSCKYACTLWCPAMGASFSLGVAQAWQMGASFTQPYIYNVYVINLSLSLYIYLFIASSVATSGKCVFANLTLCLKPNPCCSDSVMTSDLGWVPWVLDRAMPHAHVGFARVLLWTM